MSVTYASAGYEADISGSKEHDTNKINSGPILATTGAIRNVVHTTLGSTAQLFYSPVKGTVNMFYGVPEGKSYRADLTQD